MTIGVGAGRVGDAKREGSEIDRNPMYDDYKRKLRERKGRLS
jgi:hypothetical protein